MPTAGNCRRILALVLGLTLVAAGSTAWVSPSAALAQGPAALAQAPGLTAAPLAKTPSTTQPYAACPTPARRHAACQSVVVPPAAKLFSLAAPSSPASGGVEGSGLTPAELQSAYELPSSTAGSGQTVALVDAYDDPTAESDLATYRSAYGLPPCTSASGCFQKVNQTGGTSYPPRPKAEDGDWDLEESLDLDMVSAICPHCHILLVEASSNSFSDLTTAEHEAASLGATEISNSWASPEFAEETALDADFDHPGIPITAASGDWGYDNYERGASVPSYPAASPDVIAVGGTVLAPAANARGWSESAWSRTGSGCSAYEPKPSFQTDGGCAHRTTNDVAAVAEDLSVYDTTHATGIVGLPAWITVDGTSAATPIVAAVEALSESAERALGAAAFYQSPGSLFDVLSGANGSCAQAYLCIAGGGYDGPTGNGTPDGALSLSAPAPAPALTVRGSGTGSGSISSSPAGIECDSSCSASFPQGTQVTLSATPAPGSTFAGWQGPCTGTGSCTFSLTTGAAATAVFRGSGTPAGWTEQRLAAPGEREPFLPGSSSEESFYDVSLSASGEVRAKTIYNPPSGACTYATSNTGGVFLERETGSHWISEGALTAPVVGSGNVPRWVNCAGFGSVTKLSADGSTLLVSQDMSSIYTAELGLRYTCAAFVYRHSASGWDLDGTLFPPGIGASGSKTSEGCRYFGIEGAISDDGDRVAMMSDGRVDVFVREASGWALEQDIVLPEGSGCTETIAPRKLALSGTGEMLLVGEPDCESAGFFASGRVFAYTRSGSSWSLSQTIESPEAQNQNEFGSVIAMSSDGSTAAIATGLRSTGLPSSAGTAWVFEHGPGGWHAATRLTAPAPQGGTGFDCPAIAAGGARIVCGATDTVGFDSRQGSLYLFERPLDGWASPGAGPERLFATDGFPSDALGITGPLEWRMLAVSEDATVIDAPISAANIANGLYPDDVIGEEFSASVSSAPTIEGFSPASGPIGASIAITGTNLTGATAVSFDGIEASSYTVESPTQITATVPPGASSGPISVTTPGGTATSAESFTLVEAPAVAGASVSSLGEITATLDATVDPNGGAVSDCHFDYGTSASYGTSVACAALPGSGTSPVAVSAPVTGLQPSTTYHFRIVATNASGTSYGSDQTFETASPVLPELGRCEYSASGSAQYDNDACTKASTGRDTGRFEWHPWPVENEDSGGGSDGPVKLETVARKSITCKLAVLAGEYTGAQTAAETIAFKECEAPALGGQCQSAGASAGEVRTHPLEGRLGFIRDTTRPSVGWELKPASGPDLASFDCAETEVSLAGSVIATLSKIDKLDGYFGVKLKAAKGRQKPESFEGGATDVLSLIAAGAEAQAGLTMTGSFGAGGGVEIKAIP